MKKKTKSLIASALLVMSMGLVAVGCSGGGDSSSSNNGLQNNDKYDWLYEPVASDICDDDMKIDGVLDEARWANQQYLIHQDDGVVMEYTTAFSEKGMYFGAKIQDDDIQWYAKKNYEANSSLWLSIKGADVTYKYNTQEFTLFIDPVCSNMVQMTKFQAAATTNKPMDQHPDQMVAEAFLSWDTLNIDLGENGELPEYVLINPHYRHIVESGSADNAWLRPTLFFDDNDRQQQSGKFGAVGYLNPDAEGAIIGNAGNGMSKSDGWDVSQEPDGIVRSVNDHSQAIFFKDIYSSAYVFETTLQVKKGLGYMYDANTHVATTKKPPSGIGIVNMVDEISLNAFLVNGNDLYTKSARPRYETLSFYVNGRGGWRSTQLGTAVAENANESMVTITFIKNGGNFYYIIDGVLVHTEYVSYLNGPSCPGFFAIDSEVIYTDYTVEDFSDNPAALAGVLEEYGCYMVSVNTNTEGGRLLSNTGAANKGDDVEISISPDSGYLMTGFTINGEDYFDDVMNGMKKGVYTIENVQESMDIDATFTRITNDLLVYVRGDVKSTENVVVGNANISVDDANGRYHIEAGVSATGVFRIGLPMTGTFELGGKEFTFDGNYTIAAEASGYHGLGKEIKIEENSDNITGFDFRLTKVASGEMRTTTLANGDVLYHPDSGWQNHSVYYVNKDNKATSAIFSVEVTAKEGIQFAEWGWTGVGIVVSNGNKIQGSHYYDYGGNKRTMPANNYHRALFGFETTTSLMVYSGFNMNQNNNINRSIKIPSAENPTMEMTLLLNNDTFYWFVEDQYIAAWSVTDPLFTPLKPENNDTANAKFNAGDSFMFGVGAYNLSPLSPVSLRVTQELYGNDALAEMERNQLYKDVFYPSNINVKEKSENEFVMPTGWMSYGYKMTMTEPTDAAVYSIKINCPEGLAYSDAFYTNVGIKISNGEQFDSPNWYGYNDVERKNKRGSGCINWYAGGTIGFAHNSITGKSGLALTSGAMSTVNGKANDTWSRIGNRLDGKIIEQTLTVVFYEHELYIFLGDYYINKVTLTDPAFTWVNSNGVTKKFNENDKLIFGVSAVNVSNSTPVTISVLEELYGENAVEEIENNELYQFAVNFDEFRDAEPILSKDFVKNADGSYSMTSAGRSWIGGPAWSYHYTTQTPATTAVYSVKMEANEALAAATWGQMATGIIVSQGEKIPFEDTTFYAWVDTNNAKHSVTRNSIYGTVFGASCIATKDVQVFTNRGMGYYAGFGDGSLPKLSATKNELTMTMVLYQNIFYIYLDDVLVGIRSVDDKGDWNGLVALKVPSGNKYGYEKDKGFIFGMGNYNGNTDVKFTIVTEKYGDDALTEINTNNVYKYSIVTPMTANVTKNADGSFKHSSGWFSATSYSYAYTSTKFSDTVVYKTQITTTDTDLVGCNNGVWTSRIGIVFTNGNSIGATAYKDRLGTNRSCQESWLCSGMIGYNGGALDNAAKYIDVGSGPDSQSFKRYYFNLNTTAACTSVTLTAVLYKGSIYVYVDDVFKFSISLDDALFDYTNVNGEVKEIKSTDKLIFGTSALLANVAPTTKELQYLTDSEALAEITTNTIYSNIGATANA